MFGTYRLFLALCVASMHFGGADFVGCYAVFGFFVLSGYLMSLTLNKQYLPAPNGRFRFLLNRALRIYPLYWLTVIVAAAYLLLYPSTGNIYMPHDWQHWLSNITTLGMSSVDGQYHIPNLNSVAWSLSSEIIFWCVLAVLWPSRARIYAFCAIAVFYTAYLMAAHGIYHFVVRYVNPLAAALPFAMGTVVYLLREKGVHLSARSGMPAIVVLVLAMFAGAQVFNNVILDGWYGVMLLNAFVILYLAGVKLEKGWLPELDRWCGDISYPFFISHWLVGIVLHNHVLKDMPQNSWEFFMWYFPVAIAVGAVLHYVVVVPLEQLRRKVREN